MEERANITSVEALESFRASLIVYQSKARPALEEVTGELLRLRNWLENDHRHQSAMLRRKQTIKLEQAKQSLASAQYSNPDALADQERMAVRRARQALEETEMKMRKAKIWSRDFDSHVQPLSRQLDHLIHYLATDLQKGVASLTRTIRALSDYADTSSLDQNVPEATPADPASDTEPSSPTSEGTS